MKQPTRSRGVRSRIFGQLSGGEAITEYTLVNGGGMLVKVLDYGGIITELHVPDRHDCIGDVVLGFDRLRDYEQQTFYIGSIIGRCAGRIANGRFSLSGKKFLLSRNSAGHHLHGGERGFDRVVWDVDVDEERTTLTLRRQSPHGEEGYPGNLDVDVTYSLTEENELKIDYRAAADVASVVNLTQHSYFNLSGKPGSDILDHTLTVPAENTLELDAASLPTGALRHVADTAFDFRNPKRIGQDIDSEDPQLLIAGGYDHYWILGNSLRGENAEPSITLAHEQSGRQLTVLTTEPGVQIYTGNRIDRSFLGKAKTAIAPRAAICLETQKPPDAPNHPGFPGIRIDPGRPARSTTVFRFGVI